MTNPPPAAFPPAADSVPVVSSLPMNRRLFLHLAGAALALARGWRFASAATLSAWLSTQAAAWLRSRRGLASAARVDVAPAHVGSPPTIEAAVDASRLVAYVDGLVGDRADTLLACVCGDITYREAGDEMSLSRQRAQQCTAKLTEQVRKHQRAQEASCRR